MIRLFFIACLTFSSGSAFANKIAKLFEQYEANRKILVEIQQGSNIGLTIFIPEHFQIGYAPENLLTCEFIPKGETTKDWSEKITVSCYEGTQISDVVLAYDAFIQGIGGEELSNQCNWGSFTFNNDIQPIHYADHVHTGPHVLPRVKLRSSIESEMGISRFIQGDCGVLQITYMIKLDNEAFERNLDEILDKGKALICQWKVIEQNEQLAEEKPILLTEEELISLEEVESVLPLEEEPVVLEETEPTLPADEEEPVVLEEAEPTLPADEEEPISEEEYLSWDMYFWDCLKKSKEQIHSYL